VKQFIFIVLGIARENAVLTKIKRQSAGFTLVEILIVLVVILILAALLFPTFNRVREGARRSSCTSNLKQLGLAFLQYSQDHNNRLPVGKTPPPNEIGNGWAGAIFPYVKAPQLFRCPSDSGVDGTIGTVSYAYNQAIPRGGGGVPTYTSTKRLMNPSRTVLLLCAMIHKAAIRCHTKLQEPKVQILP
jgi:prepilin-type N-terminal cleavage/methylation domain-containing protein